MNISNLSPTERLFRMNIRNFFLAATAEELRKAWAMSLEDKNTFRAACIKELLDEIEAMEGGSTR